MADTVIVSGDTAADGGPRDVDVAEAAGEAAAHAEHAEAAASEVRDDAQESAHHAAAAEAAESAAAGESAAAEESAGVAQDHAEAALTAEAHMVALIEGLPARIEEAVRAGIKAESTTQQPGTPQRRPAKPGNDHWLYRRVGRRRER